MHDPSAFKKKLVFLGLVCLPILVAVFLYAAGALYLKSMKLPLSQLDWSTYAEVGWALDTTHPAYAPWLEAGQMAGLGLAVLVLFLVMKLTEGGERNLYGQARFANTGDLQRAGLLRASATALVVGRHRGRYLYLNGQQFALLAAPTRSGKGVGIVIPNLLSYQDSVVVLDIKQENFDLTSGFRAAHGQEVYLFNPYAEDGRSHRWNPLTYVASNPRFRVSDLTTLAAIIYSPTADGKDQFFKSQAQNLFVALCLFMFDRRDQERRLGCPEVLLSAVTFGELFRISTTATGSLRDYYTQLAQAEFCSAETRHAFAGMLSQNDEVFASIAGTFKEPLLPWLNPVVDMATSGDDFLLTDVRRRRMTIYIGILPNKLAQSRLMINLFFSQLINENTRELPQANPELKYQCLLLMDEFTSIGRVDILAKGVSYMAGYNLRLFPIVQSLAQLDSVYGKEDSRTMVTNHALQIIYTPRLQTDANEYSEMLGYRSATKESRTRAKDHSSNVSDEKRALMLPQEIKALNQDQQILIYEGLPVPVLAEKIRYYKDPLLSRRCYPKADVPRLDPSFDWGLNGSTQDPTLQTPQELLAELESDWQASLSDSPQQPADSYAAFERVEDSSVMAQATPADGVEHLGLSTSSTAPTLPPMPVERPMDSLPEGDSQHVSERATLAALRAPLPNMPMPDLPGPITPHHSTP